jgi:hypothetical protein
MKKPMLRILGCRCFLLFCDVVELDFEIAATWACHVGERIGAMYQYVANETPCHFDFEFSLTVGLK